MNYLKLLLLLACVVSYAQKKHEEIHVSPSMFTQIIFPSPVKHKDSGNGYFSILSNENSNKRIVKLQYDDDEAEDFSDKSNLQVETVDGYIYDLSLVNTKRPTRTTYTIGISQAITNIDKASMVSNTNKNPTQHLKNSGHYSVSIPKDTTRYIKKIKEICQDIVDSRSKYTLHKTTAISHNIQLSIKGIYTVGDDLFFVFKLKNDGNQPYDIKNWEFFRSSKKLAKKLKTGNAEGKNLDDKLNYKIIYQYNYRYKINPKSILNFVIVVPKFTIGKDKAVYLDIDEKNGERDIYLPIFHNKINIPINYNN